MEIKEASLAIYECGLFSEDDHFSKLKECLPPGWIKNQTFLDVKSSDESENDMDNVRFHDDRIELVINVVGYAPQDIKCNVTCDKIEVVAQQTQNSAPTGERAFQSNMCMTRTYELPKQINVNLTTCYLSSDGFLAITAPWI